MAARATVSDNTAAAQSQNPQHTPHTTHTCLKRLLAMGTICGAASQLATAATSPPEQPVIERMQRELKLHHSSYPPYCVLMLPPTMIAWVRQRVGVTARALCSNSGPVSLPHVWFGWQHMWMWMWMRACGPHGMHAYGMLRSPHKELDRRAPLGWWLPPRWVRQ